MAAELRQRYPNADVELIRSRGGRFEIAADGEPVFEKSKLDRFPRPGEVIELIEQRLNGMTTNDAGYRT